MRNIFVFIFIFIIVFSCFCFCGCSNISPFKTVSVHAQIEKSFCVYVCGAVANEGYVLVPEGSDYNFLVQKAGLLPETYFTQNPQALVTEYTSVLVLDWYDGEKARSCINVNGGYVVARVDIEGIAHAVIDKIANYIELNGKITDRAMLKEILGDDYAENFYKFFVSVNDYEKVS